METPVPYTLNLASVLIPKTMEPLRVAKGADASKLLSRIEWIEVAGIEKKRDAVYFVIHIYLVKDQSHLSGSASSTKGGLSKPTRAEPDYRVRRRFSEFAKLFSDLLSVVQYSHKNYCHLCNEFQTLLTFSSMRPLITTRALIASPVLRQNQLAKFLWGVINEFQSTKPHVPRRSACCASQEIPLMLNEFLFGKEQEERA